MSGDQLSDAFEVRRRAMVELQLRQRGIRDERVLAAMARVPRHLFVAAEKHSLAYEDQPLEIESGQTISQPYIVAAMLQSLELGPAERVLEVGTGSGYQTAILAELAAQVFTIERQVLLHQRAQERLQRLGYQNITFMLGDGSRGLAEHAPYDAIIVSAAAPRVPQALLDQLADPGGRLIIPVGSEDTQQLFLVHKVQGIEKLEPLDGCRFVPLIGSQGFPV
ncbi:MAG TPA: protein-L-isoaspartate(D-aspartate) O-methyltransferase [Terriglobales bacterium]|nr:protein-L-isoaspartate(D-aspartate) O-methyltransferase [Terriglobales bacterium]